MRDCLGDLSADDTTSSPLPGGLGNKQQVRQPEAQVKGQV